MSTSVLEQLLNWLSNAKLEPGDKLPTEQELCDRYGVSRTVIREVIANLKAQGLVESRRGSGMFLASQTDEPRIDLPDLSSERIGDVLDVIELRLAIEVENARLAALRRTDSSLFKIQAAEHAFVVAVKSGSVGSREDFQFHRAIAEATSNKRIVEFMLWLEAVLIPRRVLGAKTLQRSGDQDYMALITKEHAAISAAIAEGDSEAAAAAMRHHLEGSQRRYRVWRLTSPQT
ncbi:FadR/GntR family transcriptional regulator [uncultured Algimonas sp.]|uniref:FadR/GntR family transcriptional regulator n=1 Tax=uncultured Algimonas sp. TaxID=1547920 RepID=UPI0026271D87|nr:FadR/GntR family transcriptional regulator [uncultured Algimonas sp.]